MAAAAFAAIVAILWDAFETIVLPRRVSHRMRLTTLFYEATWPPFAWLALRIERRSTREGVLSLYGPLALLQLLAIWAFGLILSFAALQWSHGEAMRSPVSLGFGDFLYVSGETFFTLGYGDITPAGPIGRALSVLEAGLGLGFLALVIAYLPMLYQAFSQREIGVSLLDQRAGSPPTSVEVLRRHHDADADMISFLQQWERWCAEVMESHLSYPWVGYFRSQHDNQSWIAALTTVLDTCALILAGAGERTRWQARMTFAMARHAAVDLAQVFNTPPDGNGPSRLTPGMTAEIEAQLAAAGIQVPPEFPRALARYVHEYEPYMVSLSKHLLMPLPAWLPVGTPKDNWERTKWHGERT
jgi:Ion channel